MGDPLRNALQQRDVARRHAAIYEARVDELTLEVRRLRLALVVLPQLVGDAREYGDRRVRAYRDEAAGMAVALRVGDEARMLEEG